MKRRQVLAGFFKWFARFLVGVMASIGLLEAGAVFASACRGVMPMATLNNVACENGNNLSTTFAILMHTPNDWTCYDD